MAEPIAHGRHRRAGRRELGAVEVAEVVHAHVVEPDGRPQPRPQLAEMIDRPRASTVGSG
jgi:hypothetical protein